MRSVRYTTRFNKDVRREGKSPNNKDLTTKLQVVIDLLAEDRDLPANLHDHLLVGEFVGMRELHVKPDLLLIYRKVEDVSLELLRL
ncbi:MAG: type II toxin-antitoxin system YafQ family toxin, partial [Candidatus Nanopelagicaceae bacterium]